MKKSKIPLESVEEIKDFLQNHTLKETSEAWKITYKYAATLCKKYGVKSKRTKFLTPLVDIEQLKEYGKTHTIRECAEHFNVSYSLINSYKQRFGFVTKRRTGNIMYYSPYNIKRTGEAQDMILTLCDTYNFAAIGRVFGYSRERVRQIYEEKKVVVGRGNHKDNITLQQLFRIKLQNVVDIYKTQLSVPTIMKIAQDVFHKTLSIKYHPELFDVNISNVVDEYHRQFKNIFVKENENDRT